LHPVPYVATGIAGSSNGLRPETPPGSDDEEEKELLDRIKAMKLRKLAAKVADELNIKDGAVGKGAVEVKAAGPYQFVCVGSAAGSEAASEPAGSLAVKQEPERSKSGRLITKGKGKKAASSKGVGEGKVMAVDPYQFVCVGFAVGTEPDLGGCALVDFYPPRDLSEEDALKFMKLLHCCNCGGGPLRQSDMVLANGGAKADWQGKIFGWCRDCMDLSEKEFKSQSRITWNFRINELGKSRERARFTDFDNVMATIRADFPGASNTQARELACKRTKSMCCAWAAGTAKDNPVTAKARVVADTDYFESLDRMVDNPEMACSIDGRLLKAREISWLTKIAEGFHLCFCCRRPDCLYYGMNSQWLNLEGTNRFRCPCCIDEYSPVSTAKGQVEFSFTLVMPDMITGKSMAIPAMWPMGKDMAWLNKQIEITALQLETEVELESYINRGPAELHKLLAREAIPSEFKKVGFASHPNADVNRMWQQADKWRVADFQARGYVDGDRLDQTRDDLSHPYDNWPDFIAICARVNAEAAATDRASAAEVARRMGD
jgi:hypothetical protein